MKSINDEFLYLFVNFSREEQVAASSVPPPAAQKALGRGRDPHAVTNEQFRSALQVDSV